MPLKGHRRTCRCVGCSAETRARGMRSLRRALPNRRRKVARRARPDYRLGKAAKRKVKEMASVLRKALKFNRRRKVRHANPPEGAVSRVGTAPTLTVSGHGSLQYPRGALRVSSDPRSIYLDLGGAAPPVPGSRVTRIEYDDPVKAVEAYGEIGRFRHDCSDPFVVGSASGGSVLLTSKSTSWRKE